MNLSEFKPFKQYLF